MKSINRRRKALYLIQWTPLNGITLGQSIIEHMSYKRMLLRGIRDLINLGHFDPIIQMIPLTVIPLSGAHCIFKSGSLVSFETFNLFSRQAAEEQHQSSKVCAFDQEFKFYQYELNKMIWFLNCEC